MVSIFLRVPLPCFGSKAQGSRAGTPVEISEKVIKTYCTIHVVNLVQSLHQPEDVVEDVDVPYDPLGGVGGAAGPVERLEGEQELVRLHQLPQHREAKLVVELVVGYRTADEAKTLDRQT